MHRACLRPLHALSQFIFLLACQMRIITLVLKRKDAPYSGSDEEKAEELGWDPRQGHCALFKHLFQVNCEH